MLGFILAFWSAPTMSVGRLLFAIVTTLWILVAIQIEERDLVALLGEPYRRYRQRTSMLLPLPQSRPHDD
jgi:methanethiol S-methyltransferase